MRVLASFSLFLAGSVLTVALVLAAPKIYAQTNFDADLDRDIAAGLDSDLDEKGSEHGDPKGERHAPWQNPSSPNMARAKTMHWAFFPGIYRPSGDSPGGVEATLLYNGVGGDVGFERGKFKYAEAEVAIWLISLGVGVRRGDLGQTDYQATWAFPLLPVFPYGRWLVTEAAKKAEIGFMVKLPIWNYWEKPAAAAASSAPPPL